MSVGEHDGGDHIGGLIKIHSGRDLKVYCHTADLCNSSDDVLFDRCKLIVSCDKALYHLLAVCSDGAISLPLFDLLNASVCGGVRGGVTGNAVCCNFEKCGTLALNEKLLFACCSVDNCEGIVAVYLLCVEVFGVKACAETSCDIPAHGLALCLAAHAVEVIEYVKENRHSRIGILSVHTPELCDLVHCGHIESLKNGAAAESAVTGVCDNDTLLVVCSLIECCTESYGSSAANDSVVGENTEGNEECVHRAAETAVEACGTCEDLCTCTVEKEVDSEILDVALLFSVLTGFNNGEDISAEEFLHNIVKLVVVKLMDRGKTLCKDLTVGTVGAEGEVVDIEAVSLTYCRCLLTDGEVSRAGVIVLNAVVNRLCLDLVEHCLELADDSHIAVDAEKIFLCVKLLFLSQSL